MVANRRSSAEHLQAGRAGIDYTAVTEVPGNRVTREALAMLYTRYMYAASFCHDRDVLEVACGAGQALRYLEKSAKRVVGGDYTEHLLRVARRHCSTTTPLVRLDAHTLPFRDHSFDVLIFYEAMYYLSQPELFVEESHRVLRQGGILLICTVNREWSDFNPSPHSKQYLSARDLSDLLHRHQFQAEIRGAFPVTQASTRDVVVSMVKRVAVALHLIPQTMRGKELLKRVFFGQLVQLPEEIADGIADYIPPVPLSSDAGTSQYKVLYAVAQAQ